MKIDYLIIGQGISGTWLSRYMKQAGLSFMVIDDYNPNAPSRLAAGIINPVTGRRHVSSWMIDILLPEAVEQYTALGNELGVPGISQKNILDFFPSPQMRESFTSRVAEGYEYVQLPADENDYREYFNYDFGYGKISPVYTAHLEAIIPAWRKKLTADNRLIEARFNHSALEITNDGIRYQDIQAKKIIFCDGAAGGGNPWFSLLPFAPNKGEAVFLDIPGLPDQHIYKKGLSLVPLLKPGQWWLGSAYEWDFKNELPTEAFREKAEQTLKGWLKTSWTVTNHIASIRPATIERRPFAGTHPLYPSLAILNGMGTKGCTLAPHFARQLLSHFLDGSPIHAEAGIQRFSRILSRNIS